MMPSARTFAASASAARQARQRRFPDVTGAPQPPHFPSGFRFGVRRLLNLAAHDLSQNFGFAVGFPHSAQRLVVVVEPPLI